MPQPLVRALHVYQLSMVRCSCAHAHAVYMWNRAVYLCEMLHDHAKNKDVLYELIRMKSHSSLSSVLSHRMAVRVAACARLDPIMR